MKSMGICCFLRVATRTCYSRACSTYLKFAKNLGPHNAIMCTWYPSALHVNEPWKIHKHIKAILTVLQDLKNIRSYLDTIFLLIKVLKIHIEKAKFTIRHTSSDNMSQFMGQRPWRKISNPQLTVGFLKKLPSFLKSPLFGKINCFQSYNRHIQHV